MDEVIAQLAGSVAIEALIAIGDLRRAERLLTLLDERAATPTCLSASLPIVAAVSSWRREAITRVRSPSSRRRLSCRTRRRG